MESIKRDKNGKEVYLTEDYKATLSKLRANAPNIRHLLEDILRMLGVGDLDSTYDTDLPQVGGFSGGKRLWFASMIEVLIKVLNRIHSHNWDTTTWEEDRDLLLNPLSKDWEVGLWEGLQDFHIEFGRNTGAYREVPSLWGLGHRWEQTWPQDGTLDSRAEVAISQRLYDMMGSWNHLRRDAQGVEDSRHPWWSSWLIGFGKTPGISGGGWGQPGGKLG